MRKLFLSLLVFTFCLFALAQSGVVVTGTTGSGSGGSMSSSAGQLSVADLDGPGGSASAGIQTSTTSVTISNGSYAANGQSGFGGPFGNSTMSITDDGTTVSVTINPAGDLTSNFIVLYIDNGTGGRAVIDGTDGNDAGRRAITNANSGNLTFPSGFEASYGISIESGFGGLFSIPATGTAITGGSLVFVDAVGSSAGAASFTISFEWSEIGLTSSDSFDFVATYGNPNDGGSNMFSSNEGYGTGIENSGNNFGLNAMTFTSSLTYRGSRAQVSTTASATDWTSGSSWDTGEVPASTNQITIAHDINVNTDIIIDNSLNINPAVLFNLNSGNSITNNGVLTFESDATGTAQFTNGTGASISGDVTVQRFIPAATNNHRAYRFVTSSVNTSTSIYENWQTGGSSEAGIGTHITGSSTGANGFDATVSGNPSMLEYVDNGSGYQWSFITATDDPSTTDDNLVAGKPYNIFIRGDRNFDLSTNGNPNVDVRLPALGTLELGTSVSSGALNPAAGGFDFVGNPYQATIDMTAVTKNGINPNFMYTWDPNAATNGAYVSVDISAASTDPARYIEPGQAFFVVNNPSGGAASIDFLASAKAPAATNGGTFSTPNTRPTMTVELWDNGTAGTRYDTAKFNFDGDNIVDAMDAPEIGNWEENFSINKNGTLLSIENRAMPTHEEIILFDFSNVIHTDFELRMNHENLNISLEAILVDSYTNTEMTLSSGWNNYTFTVDLNDASSFANGRFSIKFIDTTLSTVQTGIASFEMYPNPNNGELLTIQTGADLENGNITFYTTLGQQMKSLNINSGMNVVDIKDLKAGIYLVQINSGDHSTTQKLIIK
ncbi:hypothetical protein BST97_02805 [Nonlabens spongiae]|uniref:Secretion system C-terminal sorting domain-containing protein n=1 Tax=Nonlabens spongiae TaxID=331648 RepID=A0A1W6MHD0_9FLAO|nr:T9SS type A sorting domain-containing protein [Nonlabens spongiae]ARN77013.1 hypothetical protein BST97_02805 [Nonlabens spongiae]